MITIETWQESGGWRVECFIPLDAAPLQALTGICDLLCANRMRGGASLGASFEPVYTIVRADLNGIVIYSCDSALLRASAMGGALRAIREAVERLP